MKDHATELVKLSPPASVGGLSAFGLPLNEWVYILTILYTLIMILDKLFPEVLNKLREWLKSLWR